MTPEQLEAALIDNARKNLRRRFTLDSFPVDGKPMEFWTYPISAADMAKHGKRLMDPSCADVYVDLLVEKAESENGTKLFKPDAAKRLKPIVAPDALADLAETFAFAGAIEQIIEDAEGNSEGIPSSEP